MRDVKISQDIKIRAKKEHENKNKAKIAFTLFPVSVDRLKNIADNNFIMPPKTTWIEPKMRCGLTIYKL